MFRFYHIGKYWTKFWKSTCISESPVSTQLDSNKREYVYEANDFLQINSLGNWQEDYKI